MTESPCLICRRRSAKLVRVYPALCPSCADDHAICAFCASEWGLVHSGWVVQDARIMLRACPLPVLDEIRVARAVAQQGEGAP